MKSNLVISGCVLALVALAAALVLMTVTPPAIGVVHTQTSSYDWYFKPAEDHQQPTVADNVTFLDKYDVLYLGSPDSKDIYLTFDAGYENGNTAKMLDVLKEKNVPAAFFITGHFLDTNPDLIKRMHDEGHVVGNHTVHHKDLVTITSLDAFSKEVDGLSDKYKALIGEDMPKFLRPPAGTYSELSLDMANKLGYPVVFWSFAYRDWLNDDQPEPEASLEHILKNTHPGGIFLLHANSETNTKILGDLIDRWQADGYTLKSLTDFTR